MMDLLLTNEMLVELADVVKSLMDDGESFSYYDVFCEARAKYNWKLHYRDVRDEIKDAIKAAVGQGGGYKASYFNDKNNDCIYLLFYPEASEEDEYDENEDTSDYDDTEDVETCIEEDCKVDSKNRIYIPKNLVEFSNYTQDSIYVNYFENDNRMTLTESEDFDADKSTLIKFDPSGMHVSVGKLVKDMSSPVYVTVRVFSDSNSFELFV